jgi:predicted unusual protein kinase regulating ubiquinone biosynthesis (AarF/ABC1/UbiB family)
MSQDLLTATMEIPFSVPPYAALLGRSVASLEGLALLGDPDYQVGSLTAASVVQTIGQEVWAAAT